MRTLFLASKVLPENASFAGTIAACERSLRRLRTDRLDLYYLHWRGRHPIEETFGAFERLREDGKIRGYAVSNFDAPALEEALGASATAGFAADQVPYHLEERAAERLVLPECEAAGLAMVAYSPFGHGQLPWLHGGGGRVLVDNAAAASCGSAPKSSRASSRPSRQDRCHASCRCCSHSRRAR